MTKTNVACTLLTLFVLAISCSKDEDVKIPTQAEFLASLTSKDWRLASSSDDANETEASCKASSPINTDNVWTFKHGGDFQFDHGTVTGEDCDECCADIVNSVGIWKISSDGKNLSVVLTGEISGSVITPWDEDFEIINAKIKSLSSSELVLEQDGGTVTFTVIH